MLVLAGLVESVQTERKIVRSTDDLFANWTDTFFLAENDTLKRDFFKQENQEFFLQVPPGSKNKNKTQRKLKSID